MKKHLCAFLICIIAFCSCGCKSEANTRLLQKEFTEEEVLSLALDSQLLSQNWQSAQEIPPDFLFQFYEALVIHGYVSAKEGESQINRTLVEDVITRFFDIQPTQIRKSSYYDKKSKTYLIGGLGNVLDYQIEQISKTDHLTEIDYRLFYHNQPKNSGKLIISSTDKFHIQFLSHQITDKSFDEKTNKTQTELQP